MPDPTRRPLSRSLAALILISTLLRLGFAATLGLGVDESYMVSAGRVVSLGYFDHPPAAWWLSWGAAHLFGSEAPVVVRLPFILLFALSTWLMARLGAAVASPQAGLWAAVLLNLSPVFGVTTGTWVLPDGPLDCALLGAALCLVRALSAERGGVRLAADGVRMAVLAPSASDRRRAAGADASPHMAQPRTAAGQDAAPLAVVPYGEDEAEGERRVPAARGGDALNPPPARAGRWWCGAGLCAGLAMFAKYSAVLTLAGAFLFLLASRDHRPWLRRKEPWLAAGLAFLVFSPVVIWNATHGWASFAFQGDRAAGLRFCPFAPFSTLAGEALFVLPWIWLPMMVLFVATLWGRPVGTHPHVAAGATGVTGTAGMAGATGVAGDDWQARLLACLAAPPIVLFALVSAWSSQRVLFHWAAPGYLMLFPVLGQAVADRLGHTWVRRTLVGTAVLVVIAVAAIGAQTRFDWLGSTLAGAMRRDPTIEGVDWTSLRDDLAARGLLRPGALIGVPNWRDAGKIAYALGQGVTVVCLSPDARQFGFAASRGWYVGQDMLLLAVEPPERAEAALAPLFRGLERLPPAPILLRNRVLGLVSVFRGESLLPASAH